MTFNYYIDPSSSSSCDCDGRTCVYIVYTCFPSATQRSAAHLRRLSYLTLYAYQVFPVARKSEVHLAATELTTTCGLV